MHAPVCQTRVWLLCFLLPLRVRAARSSPDAARSSPDQITAFYCHYGKLCVLRFAVLTCTDRVCVWDMQAHEHTQRCVHAHTHTHTHTHNHTHSHSHKHTHARSIQTRVGQELTVLGREASGFEALGGLPDVVRSLREVALMPLVHPSLFAHLRIDAPRCG